tara:strand:- start:1754 stop:2941 length:1188 start_codon:yes stop_codon:yes gene_type:complete
MAEIKSFKALRYNPIKVSDISTVIAPPYDVITKDQQDALYELNENNVIRVDLNKEPGDKKYTMAKEIFETWQKKEILTEDIRDSIYPYYQKFDYEGLEYERIGIVALVKLHEFKDKVILPHEETFSGPKEDRLKLMKACRANLSPIFGIFEDHEDLIQNLVINFIKSNNPAIEATSLDGILNKIWEIDDEETISKLTSLFIEKQILIADGHHRYETSLNLRKELDSSKSEYAMFYLAASNQEGLLINPTHRILTNVADSDKIFSSIKSDFIIEDCNQISEKELKPNEFYVVCNNNNLLIKCTIREEDLNQFNNMSVFAVQDKIIDSHKELYSDIKFFKNLEDAESSLSENSIGLILPKFVPGDIMSVVLNNIKMPQKSTYFYPKVATGLLFNKLY